MVTTLVYNIIQAYNKNGDGDTFMALFDEKEISRCSEVFRYRLAQILKESGIMMIDIKDKIGMTRGTMARYLTGERTPDFEHLIALSDYFHVSIDWLTGRSDNMVLTQGDKDILDSYYKASDEDKEVIDILLQKNKD